jgi:DNA-binding FadR family transcriptional regulator
MLFRNTKDEPERDRLAGEYERVVEQLIANGKCQEMPSFEDIARTFRMSRSE